MQILFNKLKKLEKQNNILVNTFLTNFLIITVLLMNSVDLTGFNFLIIKLFPSISMKLLLSLLGISILGEIIIIKKIEYNNQEIIKIKEKIQKIKKEKKEKQSKKSNVIKIEDKEREKDKLFDKIANYQVDNNLFENDSNYNLSNKENEIKVKKLTK